VNGATYLTADGILSTTNNQTLTLGSSTTGNVRVNNLTTGVVHSNGTGVLSSSPVDLSAGGTEITGILPVGNGGTGLDGSSAANGTLLIGNGTGYTLST